MQGACYMMKNNGFCVVVLDQGDTFISWESGASLIATCVCFGHDTDKLGENLALGLGLGKSYVLDETLPERNISRY